MLFGTAGVPNSAKNRSTEGGVERIAELKLDAMEVEFVRGVRMKEEAAKAVREKAEELEVTLSSHAPYFINLNADSEMKVRRSMQNIYATAKISHVLGARNVVFHPGYYLKRPKEEVFERIKSAVIELRKRIEDEGLNVVLRPETSGSVSQFGELDEIIRLCEEAEVLPCIDFSHIHARTQAYNSYEEFCEILEKVESLGKEALKDFHCHVSGIDYDVKGEKKHLNLKESDLKYEELLKALKDFKVKGVVICESPNLEEDALMLKKLYHSLR
ncbi:Xylose isomerase domain protein TIM barrel [Ferroglobus placidus DSM 10642]|uniref:Xylose isomerase domain protein TIM barrel n=1 Tax=Ferroglobus placidus (strain DSM 10642 / AEDII12DO) TaxID=589924 RepID=D3S1P1_FERPA|nr:TIM barrel protein [Ferroglobus placidus]ADC64348.1 Xylose isomerase domain protein TIM barrel [Ferroglobus placidus DSM 10642]